MSRVVLLGGGYVSLFAYRAIARLAPHAVITVISADPCHNFHGFTGEVVAGLLPLEVTRAPLIDLMPRATVLIGTVVHVDLGRRHVAACVDDRQVDVPYDQLVIGIGGREPLRDIPGLREHGFSLRAPGELTRFVEELDARRGRSVVVIGGGLAGVELAAAVAGRNDHRVTLVHSGERLLPDLASERLRRTARHELDRLGVDIRTSCRAARVRQRSVTLVDGTIIRADVVLGTIGQRAVTLAGLDDFPRSTCGRLGTDEYLRVAPNVWAAGDAAEVRHPSTGEPVRTDALWAIKAGSHAGRNIAATISGRRLKRFGYRGLGRAASFGPGHAIAVLYGVPLWGPVAWLLRMIFFLRFMPQARQALIVVRCLLSRPRSRSELLPTWRRAA